MKQTDPIKFFSKLKWIDERALTDVIESYRRDIFRAGFVRLRWRAAQVQSGADRQSQEELEVR